MRSMHVLLIRACERKKDMRILHRGGKLLSVAMLAASLGTGLLNGGFASAASTPFNVSVNPNPIILRATGTDLVATYNVQVTGVDSGSAVTFADSLGAACTTETVNGTAIATATTTADIDGRVQANFGLAGCGVTAASTSPYTITATGTIHGVAGKTAAGTYTLNGPQ